MKKLSKIGLLILGLLVTEGQTASSACMCSCADVMEATKATVDVLAFTGEVVGGIIKTSGAASGNSALEAAGGLTAVISQSVGAAMTRAAKSGSRVFTAKGFEAETIQLLAGVAGYRVPNGESLERGFRVVFDLTADGHGTTQLYWPDLSAEPLFEINFDRVSEILAETSLASLKKNDYQDSERGQVKAQFDAYRVWAANDPVKVAMIKLLEPLVNRVATYGWSDFTDFDTTKKAYLSLTNKDTDPVDTRFATIYLPNPPAAPTVS